MAISIRKSVALALVTMAATPVIAAQDDTMVVTASAIQQSLKDAPASISVITAEDLQRDIGKSATDLADVLDQVAGISKGIGTDVSSGIQIRGMPAAYTLLLVDGKRVGSSNGVKTTQQNYFDDINWIPVESIERIEIVRGPMSSLYGSDAMGGVVNIITKKNTQDWNGSLTVGTRQPEESSRGDTTSYTATLGGPLGNGFSMRLNGSWNKRNADQTDTSALRFGSGLEGKKRYNYGAELTWDINDNHQVSVGAIKGKEQGLQGTTASGNVVNLRGISELERENYSFDYRGLFDFGSAKFSAYQNKYENFASNVPIVSNNVTIGSQDTHLWNKDQILEGNINVPFELLFTQNITLGGQWMKEEMYNPRSLGATAGTSTYGSHSGSAISKGVFVEDQIDLMDDLSLTLGLRYDDTKYGSQTTPRSYLVYQATDYLTLKGGYSEGFKAPSIRQASLGFIETSQGAGCNGYADYTGGGCYTTGNNDLRPETSENWEIGALFDYNNWSAGLTFFDSRFKNKLATAPVGYIAGDTSGRYWLERVNLDTARTQGIEGNLDIPLVSEPVSPWLNKLTLRNSFTRMIKAEDGEGVMLVTTPKLTTYSSLDWAVDEKLSFALSAHYYGKMLGLNSASDQAARSSTATARIRNSYFIYGLSGQYRATKNLKFNAGVDNLFDKDPVSATPSGNATSGNNYYVPGRTFYASMTASF
ncbi:TonB-dependent receptor [Pectobacterium versatile]|uniref:TonB-dependent receptor domain-containing protein n=1 Tax=Pectobacterium versatile TaxID=2488639 RepID=UPI001B3A0F5D|nr:TonB-dependent receptor [Pectobacterium versatile]MBQ4771754.1 TonB-dependent receptor [Pectobacterium versatile]